MTSYFDLLFNPQGDGPIFHLTFQQSVFGFFILLLKSAVNMKK